MPDWGVVLASGADAGKFLHGQLTQDFTHLGAGEARLAGYCSAKGRMQASFVAWRRGADEVLLACSADLLPHMLKATGIDAARLPVATHDALAARCSDCSDKPHCADELAQGRAADSHAAFCPNAEAIRTLRGA